MSNYHELSRRGLIKLNEDFDIEHNNELKGYLIDHRDNYENIRVHEALVQKMDDAAAKAVARGGVVSDIVIKKLDKIFDRVMDKLEKDVVRLTDSIELQIDDSCVPTEE